MKVVFLSLALLLLSLGVAQAAAPLTPGQKIAQLEGELRARNFTINELIGEIGVLKPLEASNKHRCEGQETDTCVSNCSYRYANGDCGTYASDYCATNARCVPNCTYRYANGECGTYGSDFCAANSARCVPNCTYRYANGSCGTYGPDRCN